MFPFEKELDELIGKEVNVYFCKYGYAHGTLAKLNEGKYAVKLDSDEEVEFMSGWVSTVKGVTIRLYSGGNCKLSNGKAVVVHYGPVTLRGRAQLDGEYIGVAGQWLRKDRLAFDKTSGAYIYYEES